MVMLEVVQEELTGYILASNVYAKGGEFLIPRSVGRATERLEKREAETFTACLYNMTEL